MQTAASPEYGTFLPRVGIHIQLAETYSNLLMPVIFLFSVIERFEESKVRK
ncbi:MAG: hypothetical protein RHS_5993 [Robinsoniella sp. RHS]|nr:MAG: hypothetical protein RHS_5993 [Robinsoniella sp. RHS]